MNELYCYPCEDSSDCLDFLEGTEKGLSFVDFCKKYSALKNADKCRKYKASNGIGTMQYNIRHSLHRNRRENERNYSNYKRRILEFD